jgi:hypothetical protein
MHCQFWMVRLHQLLIYKQAVIIFRLFIIKGLYLSDMKSAVAMPSLYWLVRIFLSHPTVLQETSVSFFYSTITCIPANSAL